MRLAMASAAARPDSVAGRPAACRAIRLLGQVGGRPGARCDRRRVRRPVQPASPPVRLTAVAAGATAGSQRPTGAAELVVDVAGRVRHPGVVRLPAGSRVQDALAAAGGALPGSDLVALNLAQPLMDGEQVVVALPGHGSGSTAPAAAADRRLGRGVGSAFAASGASAPVDLNTADVTALDSPARRRARCWPSGSWTGARRTAGSAASTSSTRCPASATSCWPRSGPTSGCDRHRAGTPGFEPIREPADLRLLLPALARVDRRARPARAPGPAAGRSPWPWPSAPRAWPSARTGRREGRPARAGAHPGRDRAGAGGAAPAAGPAFGRHGERARAAGREVTLRADVASDPSRAPRARGAAQQRGDGDASRCTRSSVGVPGRWSTPPCWPSPSRAGRSCSGVSRWRCVAGWRPAGPGDDVVATLTGQGGPVVRAPPGRGPARGRPSAGRASGRRPGARRAMAPGCCRAWSSGTPAASTPASRTRCAARA